MNPEIDIVLSRGATLLDVVRSVRYLVLRAPLNLTFESTLFDGDELESTLHIIGYLHTLPAGCLTLLVPTHSPESNDSSRGTARAGYGPAYVLVQLRGMAVLAEHQGSGVGGALLQHVHQIARENDWKLWCNARAIAVPFYAKLGWRVKGESFDVPGIGNHFTMFWENSD